MKKPVRRALCITLAVVPLTALGECRVTLASESPVTAPHAKGGGLYGSDALAVHLPRDGKWRGLGSKHNYRDKLWFWRLGYDAAAGARPDLVLKGVKLSDPSGEETIEVRRATNAIGMGETWQEMLMLVEFPSAGCWRLTATYVLPDIERNLTFVVDVGDH
jgi:hypothetical protein